LLLVAPEAVFVQEEYRLFFGDDDFCEWLLHEITDLCIPMQTLDLIIGHLTLMCS
jgi:hypothetical protein